MEMIQRLKILFVVLLANVLLTACLPENDVDLAFDSSIDTIQVRQSHSFAATSNSSATITYRVTDADDDDDSDADSDSDDSDTDSDSDDSDTDTDSDDADTDIDADDSDTDMADIDSKGMLTARKGGTVKVIASVAADGTYESSTISHTLTITRLASTLTFTSPAATVQVGESATFAATSSSSAGITWSVTGADGNATDLADIDADSGQLTARKGGAVKVVASVAEDETHEAVTASHDVTLTLIPATIAFTSPAATVQVGKSATFAATSSSSAGSPGA